MYLIKTYLIVWPLLYFRYILIGKNIKLLSKLQMGPEICTLFKRRSSCMQGHPESFLSPSVLVHECWKFFTEIKGSEDIKTLARALMALETSNVLHGIGLLCQTERCQSVLLPEVSVSGTVDSKRILEGLPDSCLAWTGILSTLYYFLRIWSCIVLLQLLRAISNILEGIQKDSAFLVTITEGDVGLRKRKKLSFPHVQAPLPSEKKERFLAFRILDLSDLKEDGCIHWKVYLGVRLVSSGERCPRVE